MDVTPVFADDTLAAAFSELAQASTLPEQRLHAFISEALDRLRHQATHGSEVPPAQIPSFYLHRYGLKRLWRLDVEPDWRIFYTWQEGRLVVVDLTADRRTATTDGHAECSAPCSSSRNVLPRSVKE